MSNVPICSEFLDLAVNYPLKQHVLVSLYKVLVACTVACNCLDLYK